MTINLSIASVLFVNLLENSAVWVFPYKFRQPINRYLQAALYFLLLILIHIFQYFLRLCLSSQECTHLMGKIVLGVGSSEIGFSTNIVPITLQLTLIGFFSIGNPFIIKYIGLS